MNPLRAVVVAIGDELLSGARVNTNAAWLGDRLAETGVPVADAVVVGDDLDVIAEAIRSAAARADLVVVTGGLGPTQDDRTREALALVLGGGLSRDEATSARITSWYASRGRTPSESVLTQADVPDGATPLLNPVGTAPGLRATVGTADVVCVPGVPSEMTSILETAVLPGYLARTGGGVAVGTLRVALEPETVVAEQIATVEARAIALGVSVAYLPSFGEVVVRFVAGPGAGAPGTDAAGLHDLVAELTAEAERLIGDAVVVNGPESLAETVVRDATARSATVATAESLTGGLLAAALTGVPGASAVLRGGLVAYATELKAAELGVDQGLLDRVGAVDPEVAAQMAVGVRDRLAATYGVATTGVAGPDRQDGHEVGTVHVAVAGPDGVVVVSPLLRGDRERIRAVTVVHALEALRRSLRDLPAPTPLR